MEKKTKAHPFIYVSTFFAAIGGLLFGYDTGVISGAILFIRKEFLLTSRQTELVIGVISIGAVVGAALAGPLCDYFGRKKIVLASSLLFVLSALALAMSGTVGELVIGRFVVGVAIGISSTTAPLYIAELSSREHRGALVTINQLAITIGILLAFFIGAVFASTGSWRTMFALAAVPAAVQFVGMLFLPESPRWLLKKDRGVEAHAILMRVRDCASDVTKEIDHIKKNISHEGGSFKDLFARPVRKALLVGVGVTVIQQITGINCVLYYAPTIFEFSGFASAASAILATTGVGAVNVFMTFVAIWLLDRVGRKPLLLIGLGGMIFSLFMLGLSFVLPNMADLQGFISSLSLMVYVGFFAFSLGPVGFLLNSEIYPLKVRGRAMGLAICMNWFANFLVTSSFLTFLSIFGKSGTFWLYAAIGAIGWLFIVRKVPETKGKSLEEIQDFWKQKTK